MALGSVSIIPYTRADVEKMLKRAMYSEGKLVFTGILSPQWKYGASISIPEEVYYVVVGGLKLAGLVKPADTLSAKRASPRIPQ